MDVHAGNPQRGDCQRGDWLIKRVVRSTGKIKRLKKQSRLRAKIRAKGAGTNCHVALDTQDEVTTKLKIANTSLDTSIRSCTSWKWLNTSATVATIRDETRQLAAICLSSDSIIKGTSLLKTHDRFHALKMNSCETFPARTSILINGSPTSEFSLKRGLRQGDPLLSFLFIIVMEGLHMALNDGIASTCFMGEVVSIAACADCEAANLLSIGGRLTLIKSVLGSLGMYYFSIFKASEIVIKSLESLRANFFWGSHESSKKLSWVKWSGGLGVGSLSAFNKALLIKWRWRLFNFPNSLWVQVIKAFRGNEAGIDLGGCQTSGTWAKIVGLLIISIRVV
uniref:RNA-directed DNA polymerase, eukaryota, reverse transcriptase zinc-binding domain protein n=1 Tax=Tanacetum cinerariifolium TaxID=118510 RepID=A0A699HM04_TANCI|nr:RNA-directed DNA polymerase, eukaryota, reverse transcriptase zinc-binding domain protein [Tanacetum cinerariifolium]